MTASSPPPNSVQPGRAFGKYVIKRVVAEGGMATVFEATHSKLGTRVAIKLISRHLAGKPDIVARFEREARAAARLENPHVVHVIDVDTSDDGRPYIVMEYLDGRDLEDELRARGALPIAEAVGYVLEAATAVSAAHHAGVVHRDIKPANIFLAKDGTRKTIKVLDFGISKIDAPQEISSTSTQTMLGTPLYMSPEQVRSARDVDGRTDIWSLGVVLYEMISGQLPFLREDASGVIAAIVADPITPIGQLRPEMPAALAEIVMKALRKDRSERYRFVDEFASALLPFAPPWYRAPRNMSERPMGPALPAHLTSSLADAMENDRTVADPNALPDAFPSNQRLPPAAASGPVVDPSQPSAVARTTAGGQSRTPMPSSGRIFVVLAMGVICVSAVVGTLFFTHYRARGSVGGGSTSLTVTSPTPCDVQIDGVARGTTPLTQYEIAPGLHRVTCTTAGAPRERLIAVTAGDAANVKF